MQALAFQNTQFDIVDRNGQPWLRLPQIGAALGYTNAGKALSTIYSRNADEFTDRMTAVVKLQDLHPQIEGAAQTREVRIFSLRGAHLLGMLSRTAKAKEFRAWVLDVLEGISEAPASASKRKPKKLHSGLTLEQQDAIKALVKARVEALPQDKRAKGAITCWSALKSKFGCTYKDISPEKFTEAASLVARVALEGEFLSKDEPDQPQQLKLPEPKPAVRRRIRSRDDLSFTGRDAHGRMINWLPANNSWHEGVAIGEYWFDEVIELARHSPQEAYHALMCCGADVAAGAHYGHGHADGFFDQMARWAISAILTRTQPDAPIKPRELGRGLGYEPSEGYGHFTSQIAQ